MSSNYEFECPECKHKFELDPRTLSEWFIGRVVYCLNCGENLKKVVSEWPNLTFGILGRVQPPSDDD